MSEPTHSCGWSGPSWLHVSGLCASCKGMLPVPLGLDPEEGQEYVEPCSHLRCVKYRRRFKNDPTEAL